MVYIESYSTMVDGRPVEVHGKHEDKTLITDLPEKERQIVFDWISQNIMPIKTPNRKHSSYGLKHMLERETGIYLRNNQFKDAMLLSGFKPRDEGDLNWQFCISEKPITEWRKKWENYS